MTAREAYENILQHFKIIKRYGDKSQCQCPAHDDRHASLTVTKGNNSVLVHCHAGCSLDNVLSAAGLRKSDLFYQEKRTCSSWQAYVESREKKKIEAVYNYVSINGGYAFTKIRMQGKKMLYGILENERFSYGLRGQSRKEVKAIYAPDGVQAINKAISDGKHIFYVEGEKDVCTLTRQGYTAITAGGVNDWQADFAQMLRGADVYVLADNDPPGKRLADTVQADLQGIAKSAKVIVPVPDIPKADISDYFAVGHSRAEFEEFLESQETVTEKCIDLPGKCLANTVGCPIPDVLRMLAYKIEYDRDGNEKGRKVLQTVRNFETIMENDGRFTGKIRFDEFAQQVCLMGDVPWETERNYRAWSSHDDSALFSILQSDYGMNNRNDYFDALKNVSIRNRFHPVRDLLDSLKWDGNENIRRLLVDYLGVEDSEYAHQVMRLWMLGGVARVYQPGYKFDYTLILQGRQGIGKSTFLQLLAMSDGWFNDSLDSLDSDKAAQSLMGSWIIELAELKSLARTAGGVDSVKRFLTATQDKYRVPYERRADVFLRQCVFAGTTNKSDFLQDETGNRRFLIVLTGTNEPKKSLFSSDVMLDIKAAWAQAVHIWKTEKPQLILPESCRDEAQRLQEDSMADDGKAGIITDFLEGKQRTCALEIWQEALNESGRPQKWQASEITNIVLGIPGWERVKSPTRYGKYGQQRILQKKSATNKDTNPPKDGYQMDGFIQVDAECQMEIPFD